MMLIMKKNTSAVEGATKTSERGTEVREIKKYETGI